MVEMSYDERVDTQKMKAISDDNLKSGKKKSGCLGNFIFLILILLVGVVGIFLYFGLNHPYFDIHQVRIIGTDNIKDEQIIALGGEEIRGNIFKFDAKQLATQIEEIPGAESVSIKKVIPNTLEVTIHEKYILGYIKDGEAEILVDEAGTVVDKTFEEVGIVPLSVIQLIGVPQRYTKPGEKFTADEKTFNFLMTLNGYQWRKNIISVDFTAQDNILIDYNGLKVSFGSADTTEDVKYKLNLLEKILLDLQKKGMKAVEILLNVGENPVVVTRPEDGGR
jgi:cell division protein FtsQ